MVILIIKTIIMRIILINSKICSYLRCFLDFNLFIAQKSHYGAGMWKLIRVLMAVPFIILAVKILPHFFSADSVIGKIIFLVVIGLFVLIGFLFQLLIGKLHALNIRSAIKTMKKKGKALYDPEAVLTFYEDKMTEKTKDAYSELKYSVIDRVSIIEGKAVYLHKNAGTAYILPLSCIAEDYEKFIAFIRTKCDKIDVFH